MKHNYKRITALAGMTALLVSMPVSVYAGQIRNTYTANLSNVLGSVDVSALKENPVVKGSNIVVDSDTDDWDDITSRTADAAGVKLWKQRFHQIIQSFILCMKELFRLNGTTAIWEVIL